MQPHYLVFLQSGDRTEHQFSLDMSDAEVAAFMREHLEEYPRRFHDLVAQNPLAATRCFHWTVQLVISTLSNCSDPKNPQLDSIAARETPGIFGHVRAFLGVVEPQMRKALQVHMFVQLLGFSHPHDILIREVLPAALKRMWLFVASISFRSTEIFAHDLHTPSAMDGLAAQPLLPPHKNKGV